jgi:hypothetical protein
MGGFLVQVKTGDDRPGSMADSSDADSRSLEVMAGRDGLVS